MKLAVLGPPGSGKGTQSQRLSKKLGVAHISTGDILRNAIKAKTPLGTEAEKYVHKGQLVPDEVMIGIVKDRMKEKDCARGFILDGFPRTIPQAKMLDDLPYGSGKAALDHVLYFEITEKECIRRLANRKTCAQCHLTYNPLTHPPKNEGKCDKCGGTLILREDDKPETVKERFEVYARSTEPLIDYYGKSHRLVKVDASLSPEEVFNHLLELLKSGISL